MSNKHKTGGEDDSFQKVLTNPESTLTEKYVALANKHNDLIDAWILQRDKIVELQAEIKSEREKLAICVEALTMNNMNIYYPSVIREAIAQIERSHCQDQGVKMSDTKSEAPFISGFERKLIEEYDALKAKHERVLQMLEVAKVQLEGCRGAMAYAYEDRCDQYYLNVAENIIETLAKIESLK